MEKNFNCYDLSKKIVKIGDKNKWKVLSETKPFGAGQNLYKIWV